MEAVEKHPVLSTAVDVVKPNVVEEATTDESNVCHKSNGVDCDVKAEGELSKTTHVPPESNLVVDESEKPENDKIDVVTECGESISESEVIPTNHDTTTTDEPDTVKELESQHEADTCHTIDTSQEIVTETIIETSDKEICIEEGIVTDTIVEMESTISTVQFETEVLVEENECDITEKLLESQESDQSINILNELEPNIELSEVLRSSDISENIENNNSTVKHEIFNKEELLDILEGNDMEQPVNQIIKSSPQPEPNLSAAEIAMQQLSRLKSKKKKVVELKVPKAKKGEKNKSPSKDSLNVGSDSHSDKEKQQQIQLDEKQPNTQLDSNQQPIQLDNKEQQTQVDNKPQQTELDNRKQDLQVSNKQQFDQESSTDSIVKSLVMDWEDEPTEHIEENEIVNEGETLLKDSEELILSQECIISKEETVESTVANLTSNESQAKPNKGVEDGPTRRLSRVIKKKVIFDPDNPDTFTKGKSKSKDISVSKEHIPPKKLKPDQLLQRSKSKSPISKLQWKKPSPKNSKQCKRLSEVDKLLMDEGAVNMIYQLTPEAPKGKKNVKTKAEFIKKIQSSTPDGKEMKFRERKKESLKYEEGEATKILAGKYRPSLSSSVKSPSVSEDFETHSADDSIIYRRHSSSSYSSSCMSPRRLSDVEAGSNQSAARISQQLVSEAQSDTKPIINNETVFKTEVSKILSSEMINKNDCLSIKEKLNSKLSLALNKRKRENCKNDKPSKQKKLIKVDENLSFLDATKLNQFKFISIIIDQNLALICIKKNGLKICVEILKELEEALNYIDSRKDISITLLESQCGTLCSSLDLSLLLDENKDIRLNHAYELAESVRSLLSSVVRHSKLVCCGVWGACAGVALALVALSDVALASEGASFWLAAAGAPALPGAAALTARCRALPQALVNDLVIFGRRLSASEALQGGLISRVLWPDRFDEQVQNIAKDIAAQPMQTILLKKRLLSLRNNSEAENTFLSCLEAERDLLVEYWTSVEGQELLRASLDAA